MTIHDFSRLLHDKTDLQKVNEPILQAKLKQIIKEVKKEDDASTTKANNKLNRSTK